jgi:amidase
MRLLMSALSERWPPDIYALAEADAAKIKDDDTSLNAERFRGMVMSHRDWAAADTERTKLRHQWAALFREWDVVLAPSSSTPAFPHDRAAMPDRLIDIDGGKFNYFDQLVWPEIATNPGLPATAAPIGLSDEKLPIGMQIVGPYLEDRTPIAFAGLIEREFGGFVAPPGYAD